MSSVTTSPPVACSVRNRRHASPLSYTACTRIGLMGSTVPVEAMVNSDT